MLNKQAELYFNNIYLHANCLKFNLIKNFIVQLLIAFKLFFLKVFYKIFIHLQKLKLGK